MDKWKHRDIRCVVGWTDIDYDDRLVHYVCAGDDDAEPLEGSAFPSLMAFDCYEDAWEYQRQIAKQTGLDMEPDFIMENTP